MPKTIEPEFLQWEVKPKVGLKVMKTLEEYPFIRRVCENDGYTIPKNEVWYRDEDYKFINFVHVPERNRIRIACPFAVSPLIEDEIGLGKILP